MAEQVVVGIDVSKAKLDVALLPGGEQFTVSNDRHGIGELLRRVRPLAPSRAVLEATGKLEQLAVSELAAAGLPVVVINPAQVRHYAKARGKWAKTDPIDARLIAEFAHDLEPELRPLPDAETQALAALCQRRNQLALLPTTYDRPLSILIWQESPIRNTIAVGGAIWPRREEQIAELRVPKLVLVDVSLLAARPASGVEPSQQSNARKAVVSMLLDRSVPARGSR